MKYISRKTQLINTDRKEIETLNSPMSINIYFYIK